MGKILVTGATGNIGSQLVQRLKEKNLEVIAGVRSLSRAGRFSKQSIDSAILNFAQPETLETAFDGVDRLFLLLPHGGTHGGLGLAGHCRRPKSRGPIHPSLIGFGGRMADRL